MTEHKEIKAILAAASGGDVSGQQRMALERHLEDCRECREEYRQLCQLHEALNNMPDLDPPQWLATRIMARVKEETAPRPGWFARLFLPMHLKLPLEAFALVMICVTAWYVMQDVEKTTQPNTGPPPTRTADNGDSVEPLKTGPAPQAANTEKRMEPAAAPSSAAPVSPSSTPAAPQAAEERTFTEAPPRRQPAQLPPIFAHQPPGRPETAEKVRPSAESSPAPAMQRSQESSGAAAAPSAVRKKAAMPKTEMADSTLSAIPQPILNIRVAVNDRNSFTDRLRSLVHGAGGVLISATSASARCRMDASRVPDFLVNLSGISRIAPVKQETIPQSGLVIINLTYE